MAFPSTQDPLARALLNVQDTARTLKTYCQSFLSTLSAGSISSQSVVDLFSTLASAVTKFNAAAAVPGIAAYAQAQFSNSSLDIVAEFNSMVAACNNCGSWIMSNFPHDSATGYIEREKLTSAGVTVLAFTSAQLAGLVTLLNTLVGTIN